MDEDDDLYADADKPTPKLSDNDAAPAPSENNEPTVKTESDPDIKTETDELQRYRSYALDVLLVGSVPSLKHMHTRTTHRLLDEDDDFGSDDEVLTPAHLSRQGPMLTSGVANV